MRGRLIGVALIPYGQVAGRGTSAGPLRTPDWRSAATTRSTLRAQGEEQAR
jgi:hypothetical protein